MTLEEGKEEIVKHILRPGHGSGLSVDDPWRLGAIHPLLAPLAEKMVIAAGFGIEGQDWFDHGRHYHNNGQVCEQRIRLSDDSKCEIPGAVAGGVYGIFFEISQLTETAPVPEEMKEAASQTAAEMGVPDAKLVSRFPLVAVEAQNAREAARIIARYLAEAQGKGWHIGSGSALVDGWRNEYQLSKGEEKTVMRFDLRPTLMNDSRVNLVAFTPIAGHPKLEQVIRDFEQSGSFTQAYSAAGLNYAEASKAELAQAVQSAEKDAAVPDIAYRRRDRTFLVNAESVKKYSDVKVLLVGEASTTAIPAYPLLYLLTVAKSEGWTGANHLFQFTGQAFTFTLKDGLTINGPDAAELSTVLDRLFRSYSDAASPNLNKDVRKFLGEIRLLITAAVAGGFSTRFKDSRSEPCENPKSDELPQPPLEEKAAHVTQPLIARPVRPVRGLLRLAVIVFILFWLFFSFTDWNDKLKERDDIIFGQLDANFGVYHDIPTGWKTEIAKPKFLALSREEQLSKAEAYYDQHLRGLAEECYYDAEALRTWFIQTATLDLDRAPVREAHPFEDSPNYTIRYRNIPFDDMPRMQMWRPFLQPTLLLLAFAAAAGVTLLVAICYLTISWIVSGF